MSGLPALRATSLRDLRPEPVDGGFRLVLSDGSSTVVLLVSGSWHDCQESLRTLAVELLYAARREPARVSMPMPRYPRQPE